MAIDIIKALDTAYEIENYIGELVSILRVYKKGKINVQEIGDINFSVSQKQILADKYNEIKLNIQTLFIELP